MNERIKNLAEQARKTLATDAMMGGDFNMNAYEQKFAELVVEECVATLKKDMELAHIQLVPLDFKMYANGRLQRTIKEHFGVE